MNTTPNHYSKIMDLYIQAVMQGKNPKINEIITLYSIKEFDLLNGQLGDHFAKSSEKIENPA